MESNRVLELAIQELERRKATLTEEIEAIRSELKGEVARAIPKGPKSAAARKAQSLRMKNYWAAKRAKAAKAIAKRRTKTAAEKRALSRKMKAVWRKKKAATRKK